MTGLPEPATGRCVLLGVLNVTPDSFSDGGRWFDVDAAVAHGRELVADGADLVDVGGESTRPGAERVGPQEESRRVLPVIRELASGGVAVSIDTMRASVAQAALDAGAVMVNDVSGGHADEAMPTLLAEAAVPCVAMHWRGHSAGMDERTGYRDVVSEVLDELSRTVDMLTAAGVRDDRIVIDPGIGFAKTAEHNWQLLASVDRLIGWGLPVLIGASRKRFLGSLLAAPDGEPVPTDDRDAATAAVSALMAAAGVWGLRVHDVRASADAVRVAAAVRAAASDDDHPLSVRDPAKIVRTEPG